MNVIGEVVKIDVETTVQKKDGGSYPGWKLVYEEKGTGDVKTIAKHANSLKYNAALANGLKELNAGDEFTLEMVKEGEFWNPKNIFKGIQADTQTAPSKTSSAPKAGGSTYPTADERKATQCQIVRQSSLGHAVNLANVQGVKKISARDIIVTAKEFELFVYSGDTGLPQDMANDEVDID